jgi:uncharacterized protein YjdB
MRFVKIASVGNFLAISDFSLWRSEKDISMDSLTTGKIVTASSQWAAPELALEPVVGCTATAENFATDGGHFGYHVANPDNDDWYSTTLFGNKLPAEVVLTLPEAKAIHGLKYTPPTHKGAEGRVTKYAVYLTTPSNERVWVAGGEWSAYGNEQTARFRPVVAKSVHFVAIEGTGNNGAPGGTIAGAKLIRPLTAGKTSGNQAYLPPEPAFKPEHALDGSQETAWSSASGRNAQILTVDLGTVSEVDYGSLMFGNEKPSSYTIELSTTGSAWTQVFSQTENTLGNAFMSFTKQPARYARLTLSGNENGYTVREFDLFGNNPVGSIATTQAAATMQTGDELSLKADIMPKGVRNKTILWSSSDDSVLKVNRYGVLTALKAGTATITAVADADNTKSANCLVTVSDVPVSALALDVKNAQLSVGENAQLAVSIAPANATGQNIIWTAANPKIASITADGFVTAIKVGKTKVRATSTTDKTKYAECEIQVKRPSRK